MKKPFAVAALFAVFLSGIPALLMADWTRFVPVFFDPGAEIRAIGSYERDESQARSGTFGWEDTYFREKFTLFSRAYVYHPRFLLTYFSFSGVLRQEKYEPFGLPSGDYVNSSGLEYDIRADLLPEHSYRLNVFFTRFEPLYREHTTIDRDRVDTSNGIEFIYRKKPYFFNSRYVADTISAGDSSTSVDTFSAGAQYFKEFEHDRIFSLSANYNRPEFSDSFGLEGSTQQIQLASFLRNNWLSIDTEASKLDISQDSPFSGSLESDQLSFLERVTARLPWNFRSDFRYRYLKNTNAIENAGFISDLTSTQNEVEETVSHQLYNSLDSHYTFLQNSTDSDAGDTSNLAHYGVVNYNKQTRWGLLQAGVNVGRLNTETSGQPAVINESHPGVSVPGFFTLSQPRLIDPRSIQVFLRSPLPPNELVLLEEGVHYAVLPQGEGFEINVFSLPVRFTLPGTYDFEVSYLLLESSFELQTDTYGYQVSYDLFRTVRPYFTYYHSDQELVAGIFPGALFDSLSETAGVDIRKYGFQAIAEYQNYEWPVNPYTGIRLELRYSRSVSATMVVSAAAQYLRRNYDEVAPPNPREAYTDERGTVSGNVQKRFFRRKFLLTAGGTYSQFEGLVEGEAYSLHASINWVISKLDFSLGATSYHSDATAIVGLPYDRTRQYYFFNVGRKLF